MGKMSAKRRPGTDLNHDNWDDEQEQEEVGEFRKASADELKQRTFKVAKRRVRTGDGSDDTVGAPAAAAGSAFSGFGGFGKIGDVNVDKPASSPFSFLSGGGSSAASTVSPFGSLSSLGGVSSNKSTNGNTDAVNTAADAFTTSAPPSTISSAAATVDSNYYAKLKGLNQSVSAWIAKHIAENPVCLLTPIFDDYARHLKEIEQSCGARKASDAKPAACEPIKTPDFTFKSATNATLQTTDEVKISPTPYKTTFSFGSAEKGPANSQPPAVSTTTISFGSIKPSAATDNSTFSFGAAKPASTEAVKPIGSMFSFGSTSAISSVGGGASGFSFGGASNTPFTFSNIKTPEDHAREAASRPSTSKAGGADEENEEPPKNEFTPVVEDDSLHTQRCKIFVKSGGDYVDRGVGQLFIKSAADGAKTQLLVRADTNLGNILLNILLTDAVPASLMGKNNVMMICVPTPDAKPPPVTVLVRVKDGAAAEELLAQINKHKK